MALRAKFLGANLKIRRVHAASPHLWNMRGSARQGPMRGARDFGCKIVACDVKASLPCSRPSSPAKAG